MKSIVVLCSLLAILACDKPNPVSVEQPYGPNRYGITWRVDNVESSTWINSLALDSGGRPWAGLYKKGIARFDGSWQKLNSGNSNLPADHVLSIAAELTSQANRVREMLSQFTIRHDSLQDSQDLSPVLVVDEKNWGALT